MISRADFDAYNRDVEKLVSDASRQTAAQVSAWIKLNPYASVAECREWAKETMDGMVQVYADSAATLAAEWYDQQAKKAHVKLPEAITETTYSKETIDKVAHYQARKLVKGDIRGFADSCGELVENEIKQSLNETILANAKRDKKEGVRFARVTTGAETCAFCYMLASRGAVYHTREKAGEQSHYHRRCDCKIVPGFEDDKFAEVVEGYDPKGMCDRMALIEKQTGLKFSNKEDLSALSKEMKLRDKQWLMNGKIPEPVYEKPREDLFEHEKVGVDWLIENGILPIVKKEDPRAPANIDFEINDELWEMKNITNYESSISNQIKRARIKWYKLKRHDSLRIIMTCEGNHYDLSKNINGLKRRLRKGEAAILISENGEMRVLRK